MMYSMKNNLNKYGLQSFVVTFLCIFAVLKAQSQDVQPINLETVLELSGANNLTIQEYKQRQELALANLDKAKEWWLPDIYAGVQTHQLWGAAMNADGRFFLDVDRGNLWVGLGLDARWNFTEGIYQTKAAKLKVQAAKYKTQVERNKVVLKSIEAYYDFAAAQMFYQAYQQLADQASAISKQIDIQVQSGLQYESELLLSKSSLNHMKIQMLKIRTEYGRKSAALVKLLNLNPKIKLVSTDSVLSPLRLSIGNKRPEFDTAYQKRPELKNMELILSSTEIEKKTITTGLLIPELRLNTFGSYFGGLNEQVQPMFPSRYPETQQLYPTGALNVALMWKVPLGRLIYAGDLKEYNTRILIQQTQIQQVKAQINEESIAAKEFFIAAQEQIEIAFEGSHYAEEALQQSIQRQELGTVRPFEILQSQEIFIKARLDYLKAVADYNTAQYQLYVASGNNL